MTVSIQRAVLFHDISNPAPLQWRTQQVDTLHVPPANREHFFPIPDHGIEQLDCSDSCAAKGP